jgi:hypothetical protein
LTVDIPAILTQYHYRSFVVLARDSRLTRPKALHSQLKPVLWDICTVSSSFHQVKILSDCYQCQLGQQQKVFYFAVLISIEISLNKKAICHGL